MVCGLGVQIEDVYSWYYKVGRLGQRMVAILLVVKSQKPPLAPLTHGDAISLGINAGAACFIAMGQTFSQTVQDPFLLYHCS